MKRKLSDMMADAYMDELLCLEPVMVDEELVKKQTFEKLGLDMPNANEAKAVQRTSGPALQVVKAAKPRRRLLRVLAIAVAFMVILTSMAYAATAVYNMVRGPVDYFEPHSGEMPVSGPQYHAALAMDIEQYNASVGQSVTDNGKTVTLDTVAVDDNFINAFFTIVYDEPINLDAMMDGPYPAYHKLRSVTPWFTVWIDGEMLDNAYTTQDEYDPYMTDEHTVKMMLRWLVPTMLPDAFELSLHGEEYDMKTGDSSVAIGTFRFDLTIDKSASAAATRAAQPGQYAMGGRTLDLSKLAVTPFGAVMSVNGHWDPDELNPDPAWLMPRDFHITDDKGNVLNSFWNNTMTIGAPLYGIELIGAAADAESITLTPIKPKENYDDWEDRVYSVNDIGAKIEMDSHSGYYLEDHIIEGSRVSLVLRPYGQCNYYAGGIFFDIGDELDGLTNEQIDRKSGLLTYSVDFYDSPGPEELAAIQTFHVTYNGAYELDEAAAITLPLH